MSERGWHRRRRRDCEWGSKDWLVRLTRHCTMASTPPGPSSRPTPPSSPPHTASTSPRFSTAHRPLQTAAPTREHSNDDQQRVLARPVDLGAVVGEIAAGPSNLRSSLRGGWESVGIAGAVDVSQLRRGLALAPAGASEVIGTSEEPPLQNPMERRPRARERQRLEDRQWQLPHADGCESDRAALSLFDG